MALIDLRLPKRKSSEGFLVDYLNYTKEHESPEDFHAWVAMSLIGIAAGRNVWLDRGFYRIYPNLYVILIAESALLRKSSAIKIGVNLLRESLGKGVNLFAQKVTTESFIHYLSEISKEKKRSIATVISDELAVTLGQCAKDPSLLHLLTSLYDNPDHFEYSTIIRGIEVCDYVCLNMLAGSTPEWLKSSMPEDAIGGGFYSRLIPVNRTEAAHKIPHPEDSITTASAEIRANLVNDLQAMHCIEGQFHWDAKAKQMFADWYCDYLEPEGVNPYLRGYYGRKGDTIIKLAMLSSLSKSDNLMIQPQDFMFALRLIEDNEKHMTNIITKMGQSESGKELELVLESIKRTGTISHSQLQRNFSYRMDRVALANIIGTLKDSGAINVIYGGRAIMYQYGGKKEEKK